MSIGQMWIAEGWRKAQTQHPLCGVLFFDGTYFQMKELHFQIIDVYYIYDPKTVGCVVCGGITTQ